MIVERWTIDSSPSAIHFAVRHLMISNVRGRFSRWSGTIRVDAGDWERATVDVVIDASSINTGIQARDAHLRTAEYLDVTRYPDITLRARLVPSAAGEGRRIVGELTLKGQTTEVELQLTNRGVRRDRWGNDRAGFKARTTLDRRALGITGNMALDSGGVVIGHRIQVDIEVEAVRQPTVQVA